MPAKDNVVIRMTAEDAGAFEEWRKQAKGPEMFGEAMEKSASRGKHLFEGLSHELLHHAGQWASVAAAIHAAKQVFEDYVKAKRELEQGEARASAEADLSLRGYFKTARITGEEQQGAATQRIGTVALKQKTSLQSAGAAANLLAQFGVSRDQAEGGALEEMLQMQQAAPAGADPQDFSRRVLDIIRRSTPGGKVSTDAIHKVGVTMRQLTSSDLGFNENAVELYAKHATMLKEAGYDTSTGMALSAAISEKYDPRQARSIIKDIAKPGMQKGEAAFLARARGALGAGGEAQYKEAAEIGRGSVASLQAESQTGATMAEFGEKKLTTDQIRQRLLAVLRARGDDEDSVAIAESQFKHTLSERASLGMYEPSDEARVNSALGLFSDRKKKGEMMEQILGRKPLPTTIRIKGQDGRDVPHHVEAAAIPGR